MIKVHYMKSEEGYANCFDLTFELNKYIPEVFFKQHENGDGAELYFYISLFYKFGMFDCRREHYHSIVWSTYYDCNCNGIPFHMIYDHDYDMVSFSVLPTHTNYCATIAETISNLIETQGMNVELKV